MFLSKTPTLWPPVPPPAGSHQKHHRYSGGSSHGESGGSEWGNTSYKPKVFDDKAFAEVRQSEFSTLNFGRYQAVQYQWDT